MTTTDLGVEAPQRPRTLIQAFPEPGDRIEEAYEDLAAITSLPEEERQALGTGLLLPRPWDPPTCTDPDLREEIWDWLDRFITWLNHEYVWDLADLVPACWPAHAHLVHEIATLADRRRAAANTTDGADLEDWHRITLPAFTQRMRHRLGPHCQDRAHQPWPARSSHTRHQSEPAAAERQRNFNADIASLEAPQSQLSSHVPNP